jgi:hypothetical protein
MQSVEEFMRQYFDERIAEEKREQVSRAPFRRRFHADDCFWDSRAGTLEMIQSERVVKMSNSDAIAEVITERESPSIANSLHQLRYHLQASSGGWLIRKVDVWCHSCHGKTGNDSCFICHGTGWHDRKPLKRDIPPQGRF